MVQNLENKIDPVSSNALLNKEIDYSEIETCKDKKITRFGPDSKWIVMKNSDVILVIYKLCKYCFSNCCLPSIWLKSIINPIPKGA